MMPRIGLKPIQFKEPFMAGVFVATLHRHQRDGYVDALGLEVDARIKKDGTAEVRLNRPISEILYRATMTEVENYCDRIMKPSPPSDGDGVDPKG